VSTGTGNEGGQRDAETARFCLRPNPGFSSGAARRRGCDGCKGHFPINPVYICQRGKMERGKKTFFHLFFHVSIENQIRCLACWEKQCFGENTASKSPPRKPASKPRQKKPLPSLLMKTHQQFLMGSLFLQPHFGSILLARPQQTGLIRRPPPPPCPSNRQRATRRNHLTGTVGLCRLIGGIGAAGGAGTEVPSWDTSGAGPDLRLRLMRGCWGSGRGTGTPLPSTAALFRGCTRAASFLRAASSSFFMLLNITMDLLCFLGSGLAGLWLMFSGEGSSKPGDVFGRVW